MERLGAYAALLKKWNPTINLVSRDSLIDLWRRHFLDSAQLDTLIPGDRPLTLLDLGSGAGFPGLVLAILARERQNPLTVHLVESDARKVAFLATVLRETGTSAQLHHGRIEQLTPFQADLVTTRALAPVATLLEYAYRFLHNRSICLFPKGAGVEDELTAATKHWKMAIDRLPSRSGPTGIVLRLRNISRV